MKFLQKGIRQVTAGIEVIRMAMGLKI